MGGVLPSRVTVLPASGAGNGLPPGPVTSQGSFRAGQRAVSQVREPGLVIEMAGHPRAFAGRVYVPALVPEGLEMQDLH